MPSGFWTGFAGSASSQIEKILDERRKQQAKEREPSFQLQKGLVGSMQSILNRPTQPQMQEQADLMERDIGGKLAPEGSRFDMQSALASTPRGQAFGQADRSQQFVDQLQKMGISGLSGEGVTFNRQPDFATTMAQILAMNQNPPLGGSTPQTPPTPPAPTSIQPNKGIEALPVINRGVQGIRAVQRFAGGRQTQSALMKRYTATTASFAKALGDSGNIAIEERKMMENASPQDGETWEARQVKDRSMMEFFDQKQQVLNQIISQPIQQIVSGTGRGGVRTILDPAAIALKKKAQTDMLKLQEARVAFRQMFDEAQRDMPAIGQPSVGVQSSPAQGGQGGKVRVKRLSDGKTGSIDPADYDPSKYQRM